jgi:hypothetical protein
MSLLNISNEVVDLSNGATIFLEKFYDMDDPLPTDEEFLAIIVAEYTKDNSKMPDFPNIYMGLLSENIYSSLIAFYSSDEFSNRLNDIYVKKVGKVDENIDSAITNVLEEIDENVFTDIVDDCYEPAINSVATNYKINIAGVNGESGKDIQFQDSRFDDICDCLVKIADYKCDLINKIDNEYKRLVSLDKTTENTQEAQSAPTL